MLINSTILSLAVSYSYSRSTFFEISKSTFHHFLNFQKFNFDKISGHFFKSHTSKLSLNVAKSYFSHFNSGVIRISSEDEKFDLFEGDLSTDDFRAINHNLTVTDNYFRYFDIGENDSQIIYVTSGDLIVNNNYFYEIHCSIEGSLILCNNTAQYYLCNETRVFCDENEYEKYGNDTSLGYEEYHTVTIERNTFLKIILDLDGFPDEYLSNDPWIISISTTNLTFSLNSFDRSLIWDRYSNLDISNKYPIIFNPDFNRYNQTHYKADSCNFSRFDCGQPGFAILNPANNFYSFEYMQFQNGTVFQGCFVSSFQLEDIYKDDANIFISFVNFYGINIKKIDGSHASCIFILNGNLNVENCVFLECQGPVINSEPQYNRLNFITINNCYCDLNEEEAFYVTMFNYSLPTNSNNQWGTKPTLIELSESFSGILTPYIDIMATLNFSATYEPTPLPTADDKDYNSAIANSNTAGVIATVVGIILIFYFAFLLYVRTTMNNHFYVIGGGRDDFSSDECLLLQWWKRRHEPRNDSSSDLIAETSIINKGLLDEDEDRSPAYYKPNLKDRKENTKSSDESSDSGPKAKQPRRRKISTSSSD